MPRLSVATCAAALPLLVACAGGRGDPLEAHGVALAADGEAAATARPAAASPAGVAGASPRWTDGELEQRLLAELHEKRSAGGATALELIEPGPTIESRLRFALSRSLLDREPEAAAALVALTAEAPHCGLAWLLLGQIRGSAGDPAAAAECFRRARSAARQVDQPPHPALGYLLGRALLQTDERDEGVRLLREELAAGGYRVPAAELLALVHAEEGDFEGALACLDAVLDDVADEPSLVVLKVEVLADQLRFDDALDLLQQHGTRIAQPLKSYRRALVLHQRGDLARASAVLDAVLTEHADDPTVAAARQNIEATRAAFAADAAAGRRRPLRERELLGVLRYAPQPSDRARAARLLCTQARPARVAVAVRWALRDRHEIVRVAALQGGMSRCANPADLLATGLQDEVPSVRAAAAIAASRLPARTVFAPLVAALEREADAETFRTLHRALSVATGDEVRMPFDGERDPEVRAQVAREWRARLAGTNNEGPGT